MNGIVDFLVLCLVVPFALAGAAAIVACHGLGYLAGAIWGVTKECRDEFRDQFRFGYFHMTADREPEE